MSAKTGSVKPFTVWGVEYAGEGPWHTSAGLAMDEQGRIWMGSYSSRLIDEQERVSVHVNGVSIDSALKVLFSEHKVRFEIVERQIVLKKARRLKVDVEARMVTQGQEDLPVQFTISGYVKDARTGVERSDVQNVLDGDLEEYQKAFLLAMQEN